VILVRRSLERGAQNRSNPIPVGETRVREACPHKLDIGRLPADEDARQLPELGRNRQGFIGPLTQVDDNRVRRIGGELLEIGLDVDLVRECAQVRDRLGGVFRP
jgi:hypothetical protein